MKSNLACTETWKAFAPPPMHDGHSVQKKLIAVRKLGATASFSRKLQAAMWYAMLVHTLTLYYMKKIAHTPGYDNG